MNVQFFEFVKSKRKHANTSIRQDENKCIYQYVNLEIFGSVNV